MKLKHCNTCGEEDQGAFSASRNKICKACKKAQNLAWRLANPGAAAASSKKFRDANPGKNAASTKKWREENPGKANAHTAKRRATKLEQTPEDANIELIKALYTRAAWLRETFGVEIEVDHIIPLSKGGEHTMSNLQLLPMYLNRLKGAKLWVVK